MLRMTLILASLLTLAVVAGCGGGGDQKAASGAPLPLWQRVLLGGDIQGFVPDPEPPALLDLQAFVDQAKDAFVRITPEEAVRELTADAFAGATITTQARAQVDHPIVASAAVQLGSEAQAERLLEWAYADSLSPCPNVCNVDIETFDVSGIPGAKGIRRSRTENASGAGDGGPFESFEIEFVDGPFLYDVLTLGAMPGEIQRDDVIAAAQALYERVKGSPPLAS